MKNKIIGNAVLLKDMTLDIKKPKVMILILAYNALLLIATLIYMLVMEFSIMDFEPISPRILIWMFITHVIIEAILIALCVPAMTAGSISIEKEKQTLEVLLTTRMTPFEIVIGKFTSVMSLVGLLIISTMPLMSLVFIFGGINILEFFLVIFALVVCCIHFAAIGVFWSATTKNTIGSVILTYITVFASLVVPFIILLIVVLIIMFLNDRLYKTGVTTSYNMIPSELSVFTLITNPFALLYDVIGNTVGYSIEDGTFFDESWGGFASLSSTPVFNVILKFWSLISVAAQLGISYLYLKAAGHFLNPVRKKKKKKSNFRTVNGVEQNKPVASVYPNPQMPPVANPNPQMQTSPVANPNPQMQMSPVSNPNPQMQASPIMNPNSGMNEGTDLNR